MKRYKNNKRQRRSGMALLTVLFIVFAITVISMGILCRSDMALACGQNLCLRNQSDYLAWAGLEHARAVIQSYDSSPLSEPNEFPKQLDALFDTGSLVYNVSIEDFSIDTGDPNHLVYIYDVSSEASYGSDQQARSFLRADIRYSADDPNGMAVFSSIRRQ
jgi:hypothetical protein